MSYAAPSDWFYRKNPRLIGDLVVDDGSTLGVDDLATHPVVLALLSSASGIVDAALLKGQRYQPADLAGLTGTSQDYLKQIVCDIATSLAYARKPAYSIEQYKAAMELSDTHLDRLRTGDEVFDVVANIDAGTPTFYTPQLGDYGNLQLIRDQTLNYYPARRIQGNQGS